MINYYRKKPIDIMGIKFNRNSWDEIKTFTNGKATTMIIPKCTNGKATCQLRTHNGYMTVNEGDYIVRDIDGKYYTYSSYIFEQTYELMEYC